MAVQGTEGAEKKKFLSQPVVLTFGRMKRSQLVKEIPHGKEAIFLDSVTVGKRGIRGYYDFSSARSEWFKAHFPGRPVMPGKAIAEAASLVGLGALAIGNDIRILLLLEDKNKYLGQVRDNTRVIFKVESFKQVDEFVYRARVVAYTMKSSKKELVFRGSFEAKVKMRPKLSEGDTQIQ